MTHTTKPQDTTLHYLPATVLDVRGAGLFLVVNSSGFMAVANVIHTSAHDGLVAVHDTGSDTLVQCVGVEWMASLSPAKADASQRDTGLDRFAQEYQNKPAFQPSPQQEPVLDESGFSSGATVPGRASNDPDRNRVVPILSDWPMEIDAIAAATRNREASSLRGNTTLDEALEAA